MCFGSFFGREVAVVSVDVNSLCSRSSKLVSPLNDRRRSRLRQRVPQRDKETLWQRTHHQQPSIWLCMHFSGSQKNSCSILSHGSPQWAPIDIIPPTLCIKHIIWIIEESGSDKVTTPLPDSMCLQLTSCSAFSAFFCVSRTHRKNETKPMNFDWGMESYAITFA